MNKFVLNIVNKIKATPLWIYPLTITFLLFLPVKWLVPGGDGLWYMDIALNIYKGFGLADTDLSPVIMRPLYPILLSISFWLFGISIETAFMTTRIFYIFNSLLVYFVGQKLYGRIAGLVASLLVLSSFTISEWSAMIYLDHVLPAFMLLSLLLTLYTFEKQKFIWFILSGLSLGMACLVKETAALFLPLPLMILLLHKEYRNKKCIWGTLILIVMILLIILPWIGYVYSVTRQAELLLGSSIQVVSTFSITRLSEISLEELLLALVNYYRFQVGKNFFLAPLFVVSWAFTLILALRNEKSSRIMIFTFLLHGPLILFQGLAGYRASQAITLFLLSYVALANFLLSAGRFIESKLSNLSPRKIFLPLSRWVSIALACTVIIIQGIEREIPFDDRPYIIIANIGRGNIVDHFRRFNTIQYLLQEDKAWDTNTRLDDELAKAMLTYIPPRSRVMSTWARGPYWSTRGNYPIYSTPWIYFSPGYSINSTSREKQKVLLFHKRPPLAESSEEVGQYYLGVLTEENLLGEIQEKSIDYIVVTSITNFEYLYFMNNPGFVQVASIENGQSSIFKVIEAKPYEFETYFVDETLTFFQDLKFTHPQRYNEIEISLMKNGLGWGQDEIRKLLNGEYPSIKRMIGVDDYVSFTRAHGLQFLAKAITIHKEKTLLIPENPWSYVTLGALYLAQGNTMEDVKIYKKAAEAYQQAFTLAPSNPEIRNAVIKAYFILGDQYFDAILPSQVIEAYVRDIQLEPNKIETYWKLIEIYENLEQFDQATSVCLQLTERWPDRADAHLYLGRLYEAQGEIEAAIAEYKKVVELESTLAQAYIRLGNLYQAQNKREEAIDLYRAAAKSVPTAAWPHIQLGKIYLEQANLP